MLAPDCITSNPALDARGLHRLLWSSGGFTLDHNTGRPLDRGIAVCADPEQTWAFSLGDWDDERVAGWIAGQQRRLAEGDVHLGGWLHGDPGRVWLELVWVLPNRLAPAALAIARLHEQRAVFDLTDHRVVAVDQPVGRGGPR